MIADRIENLGKYESYEPELGAVRAFLIENDPETLAPGRYEINGNVFVNVVAYAPGEAGGFEAHREYSDLQYVVSGDEEIDWIPLGETADQAEYSTEADCAGGGRTTGSFASLYLTAGAFAIFEPDDVHRPGVKWKSDNVKKLIFKIRVRKG